MKKDRKIFVIVAIVTLMFVSFLVWRSGDEEVLTKFNFTCENKKTVNAVFVPKLVHLTLSDGRKLELNQLMVRSGGDRYTSIDGSITFSNTDKQAFLEENNVVTYKNCSVDSNSK